MELIQYEVLFYDGTTERVRARSVVAAREKAHGIRMDKLTYPQHQGAIIKLTPPPEGVILWTCRGAKWLRAYPPAFQLMDGGPRNRWVVFKLKPGRRCVIQAYYTKKPFPKVSSLSIIR